ncbi:MAG: hypothetical protein ACRD2S_00160 [Terriglobales bacterium]
MRLVIKPLLLSLVFVFFGLCIVGAQQQTSPGSDGTSKMDMSSHDISRNNSAAHEMPGMTNEGTASAMHNMEGHHMDMGPHMRMTALRNLQPGDKEKAEQVVEAASKVAEKYQDYRRALADGFQIFLPNVPQKQYHFTNYSNAFEARFHFNPDHPTSLLYVKTGEGGYKLIGVMYTAQKDASEDELNSRIPLSIAQWHAHINLCTPPAEKKSEAIGPNAKFGLAGSIASKGACDAAGGKFIPQIFGWMVHVYPFEQKPEDVWSVERQASGHMD